LWKWIVSNKEKDKKGKGANDKHEERKRKDVGRTCFM
jgi:hypothetical protein